jgi:hypothetical protein
VEEKRRVIHMRIKLGNKIYKMRKEAELAWELAICAILVGSFFPMVRVFAHIIVFIAKEVMHYGI